MPQRFGTHLPCDLLRPVYQPLLCLVFCMKSRHNCGVWHSIAHARKQVIAVKYHHMKRQCCPGTKTWC